MSIPGYQCQKCWATFQQENTCEPTKEEQAECPTCHSTNIRKVDLPESWVDRARSSFRFG